MLAGLYNKGLPRPRDLVGQLASCQNLHRWTEAGSVLLHPKRCFKARFSAWCVGSCLLQIPPVCLFSSVERKRLVWGGGAICTFLLHQCGGRDVTGNGLKVSSEERIYPLYQEHHVKAANAK